jgi:hypothetical protein
MPDVAAAVITASGALAGVGVGQYLAARTAHRSWLREEDWRWRQECRAALGQVLRTSFALESAAEALMVRAASPGGAIDTLAMMEGRSAELTAAWDTVRGGFQRKQEELTDGYAEVLLLLGPGPRC